jgi:hypothetical protein
MTPRQAAALALVGWYIMLPILAGQGADVSFPISEWTLYGERKKIHPHGPEYVVVLKSEQECEQKLGEEIVLRKKLFATTCTTCIDLMEHARCVASDDPRLKSNWGINIVDSPDIFGQSVRT